MHKPTFRKTPLAQGIAFALGLSTMAPGFAQTVDEKPAELEEIVVTGIRASLEASMDLKREATGVVDAITAEDMGDFPDSNLAESLQRITGVSIDRDRGEGARVTIRGFGPDFNLVTLNGRQMPTTSGLPQAGSGLGRSFDFGNLASEGIASVEVYKSGRADIPTGGIGATININTTRPLDTPGFKATAAASGMYDDSRTKLSDASWTPEFSGLISDTFMDDRVGVSLSLIRQERESGGATASVGGWRTFSGETDNCWCGQGPSEWGGIPPATDPNQQNRPGAGDIYSVPQVIGYELADYDRTRTNGQLTFQVRPVDNVTATLDYTYSELELDRTYNNLSAWFNFAGQETLWTDGPNATPLTYTENSVNSDFAMGAGTDAYKNENQSLGFNLEWEVNDSLSLELDYHDSSAKNSPNSKWGSSALLAISSFTRNRTTGYFGRERMPVLELGLVNPLSPNDMIVTGSVFVNNFSEMDINQGRLSGNFEFDTSFVESVDFGVQFTDVDNRAAGSVIQRDAWGGVTQRGAIADLMSPANLGGSFDQVPGGTDSRRQSDFYTYNMAALIARTEALIASGDADLAAPGSGDFGPCGTGLCPSDTLQYDRLTNEETRAAYVQLNMATELASKPIDMRLGLRYEQTDVVSEALSPNYTGLVWVAGNELSLQSDGKTYTQGKGDYDYLLPNFDFSIDLTDQFKARASLSRTLARPGYGDIQGGLTLNSPVRITEGTGARGNPALLPYVSDNLDLSLEWYYGNGSYIAGGYFRKKVQNFIGTSSVRETPGNLPHPALGPLGDEARAATGSSDGGALYSWILANRPNAEGVNAAAGTITGVAGRDPASPFNLSIPVNIEDAVVDGWEFVVQHNFGDSGFGVIANATLVDADVAYDNLLCEQPNCNLSTQFVVTGLSDSANVVGYYEKNAFGVRLAYNWRDDFLAGTGQTNMGAGPPSYVAAYGQLDLNASYKFFDDKLTTFVDILNLTNETSYVYGRDKDQPLFATQLGTRYNVGVRYKF
ncbi:MAG: TonB-dependent receptor [Gammaproteobacteria bacterium]|nr:TonB-dependent receptor [Gammaproteobacteria bacterium]